MASEDDVSERLLERLVSDPAFRAAFRRDPVAGARSAGLDGLADDLLAAGSDPLQTLDLRESRSSLAGVVMAAAFEGIGLSSPHPLGGGVHGAAPATPEDVAASRAANSDRRVWASHVTPEHHMHEREPAVVDSAEPVRGHERVDPAQYGLDGSGGRPSAETVALLRNHHVSFDADGIADLRAGRIDPRVVSVLATLSRRHTITISAMCSDHPRLTAGGSVSNHSLGRAVDIATVDGRPVGPGNEVARRVAIELSSLPRGVRPSEIGSPWALAGPAYFTDAAHQNHLHIGFDDPITPDWRPPAGVVVEPAAPERAAGDAGAIAPDDGDSGDDDAADDGDVREDGGSGDTEAEADDDEDSGDDEDDTAGDGGATDDDADNGDTSDSDGDDGDANGADPGDAGWQDPGIVVGGYPGDSAPREDVATWMASQARRRGIPPELPVMAALVESGLRNISYGDADSVGFFQMRAGTWDRGPYAGYGQHPELQLKWFLDQAVAAKRLRVARGLPVDDPKQYGAWIADIERPAEQYRGRYQPRLAEARELLEQAAASSRARPPAPDHSADVLRLHVITPEQAQRARSDRG